MKSKRLTEYFEEVELNEEYDGYFCSVAYVITIAILGSICGLRNIHQIHQWAASNRVSEFLREKFGINHVPCYYWILSLLHLIKPESLNRCFADWVYSFMPEKSKDMTISLDGKTICSTIKMEKIESPLHIISAQVCEIGLTLAQCCTDDKSNEIPAVQDWCRIQNKAVQQCLNMFRKTAINLLKQFKLQNNSSQAISNLMFECLLDSTVILSVIGEN